MENFYEDEESLFVAAYDALHGNPDLSVVQGDTEFYAEVAANSGSRVLELACGTGRVLFRYWTRAFR